ncbi:PRC-barrel domain-containing protein [Salinarimonas rosea]|uniref:PRC-barrel domain-containing protein n=1 Tax=Salinarimonas rosea TaxID=552063 RepID=UPI00040BCC4D|nr:PRC-barrel domain-containing protein [Salinarimonas rosea]
MPARRLLLAALLAGAVPFAAGSVLAQDATLPEDPTGSISDAASALKDAGENALLVRDLLGMELTDPSGETAGTVRDFVVIPGGRLVAALVETPDGTRVPVPFAAIKLAAKGDAAQATLARPLSEVTSSDAFQSFEDALPTGTGG